MNNIKLLGRLTATPEIKYGANGRAYAAFTLAVPRRSNRDEADFIHCMAFDKLASALGNHCGKGRQILLDGRLEITRTQPQGAPKPVYYSNVIANTLTFLHDPNRQQAAPAPA